MQLSRANFSRGSAFFSCHEPDTFPLLADVGVSFPSLTDGSCSGG